MTRSVVVMAVPDPRTCTPAEWDAYLESVDIASLTRGEVDVHRVRVEQYTARLLSEQTAARVETARLLDARDQAAADAEALSARCRGLHEQVVEAGQAVLRARVSGDAGVVRDALDRETYLLEALAVARAELATANLRAVQTQRDAR